MRKKILTFIVLQLFSFACISYISRAYGKIKPGNAAVFKRDARNTGAVRRDISGTVRDSVGVMPGVSVKIKGSVNGTTTDGNGRFILNVPDDNAILVFSMVGYVTQEIPVTGKNVVNVTLRPSQNALDEVVVIAFGTQKKTDMVGSVTSISVKDLKIPSSNLTTALAGRAAGVIAYQRSGEPGQDNADFFVRGHHYFWKQHETFDPD